MAKQKETFIKKVAQEYKEASPQEVWLDGVLYNFIYGVLGALVIVAIKIFNTFSF